MSVDDRLIKSAALLGTTVNDAKGHKLGVVREIFLDRDAGIARFVVLELSSLFGGGGKFYPVPWRILTHDDEADVYVADLTKDQLKAAPAYDREQLNSASYGWGQQVERYFAD